MKKFLALILAAAMIFSFAACGEKKEDPQGSETSDAVVFGALTVLSATSMEISMDGGKLLYFDDLNSLLLAIESKKVFAAEVIPECVGAYAEANSSKFIFYPYTDEYKASTLKYSMGVKKENTELLTLLNSAIDSMISDKTIEKLEAQYIGSTEPPVPSDIPVIEGAKTVKVAVTGDLPPLDYVTTDGKAAGFNVAVLAEISKRANVNIQLVPVTAGSRAVALSSGKVDALFWVRTREFDNPSKGKDYESDIVDSVVLTTPYHSCKAGMLELK